MTSVRDTAPRKVVRDLIRAALAAVIIRAALAAATNGENEDPELLTAYAEGFATGMTARRPYPLASDHRLAYIDGLADGKLQSCRRIHPAKEPSEAGAMEICSCGATTTKECCAAFARGFRSLGQCSDGQLAELVEDDCQAAALLLARRRS